MSEEQDIAILCSEVRRLNERAEDAERILQDERNRFEIAYGNCLVERDHAQGLALRAERALAEALAREALLKARIRQFADDQENMSHTDIRVWCNEATVWTDSSMLLIALARAAVATHLAVVGSNGFRTLTVQGCERQEVVAVDAALADPTLAQALKEQK